MRLLHLSPLAMIGGCEVNCLRVIQHLHGCEHQVLVFDEPGPMSEQWQAAGARVQHLRAWTTSAVEFRQRLTDWGADQAAPDGICYWSSSRLPLVLAALRQWSAPWAVHLGNPAPLGIKAFGRNLLYAWQARGRATVKLVACSQQVADSHRRAPYFRRFPIDVVYNGVPAGLFSPNRSRHLPTNRAPRIGMIARLDGIKDHATLLRAMVEVARSEPEAVLEFAGDGPLRRPLEEEARLLGVADRVHFLGFVPIAEVLSEWDLYVHSTTTAEGMGTAVAEAMMAGLPCLVSDLPVMREICGRNGASFAAAGEAHDWARKILYLLANWTARERLGLVAERRARENFTIEKMAEAYGRIVLGRSTNYSHA